MNNKKSRIIIGIFVVIIIFLGTLFVISNTLSVFKASGSSTTTIQTAVWDVSLNQTGVNNNLSLVAGVTTQDYILNITSTSEVDVTYNIVISGIPSGVEIKLDSGSYTTPTSGSITFSNAGTIRYSDVSKERSHTLTFKANSGATEVTNQSVSIDVVIQQEI